MVQKWTSRLLVILAVLSLALVARSGPSASVQAQTLIPRAYFPLVFKSEPIRFDDFADQDPVWQYKFPEVKDGVFFHRNGVYVAQFGDNSANGIAWPGWRPLGDYKLEVDARFAWGKWMNSLGLIFAGNDTWTEYYAFMLAFNFAQHHWNMARVEPPENYVWLQDWVGAPPTVRWYNDWNHLMVVRIGNTITAYCNGYQLGNTFIDGAYGTNRLVGLLGTTFEWGSGENEYDNFQLTPLSNPY